MLRVTADESVELIRSGDTLLIGGSGSGHAVPELPAFDTIAACLFPPQPIALAAHLAGRTPRAGSTPLAAAALSIAGE